MTLVLIPGLKADARSWGGVDARLGGIIPDHHFGAPTIDAMAAAILARAPERFDLAGHSMGGYVAFAMLRLAPERIRRVAFVATQARPDSAEATARRREMMALAVGQGMAAVTEASLDLDVYDRRPDVIAAMMAIAAEFPVAAYLSQQEAVIARPDSRPSLSAITCPTAVIGGVEDRLLPPYLSEEIAAGIPGATLDLIPACGHCAPLEQPDRVAALLAGWLERTPC
jgi:pimeloyl-ACP methyl ester carboxylesterase